MKQSYSPTALIEKLADLDAKKRDLIVQASTLRFQPTENGVQLLLPDTTYKLTPTALNQLCIDYGVPKRFMERLSVIDPELLSIIMNRMVARKDPSEKRMLRTIDDTARAYLSQSYARYDNIHLFERIMPSLTAQGLFIESCHIDYDSMHLKARTERITGEIRKGDVVQYGLHISNGESGLRPVTIEPMLFRLVCTNGMIASTGIFKISRRHVGKRRSYELPNAPLEIPRVGEDDTFWRGIAARVDAAMGGDNHQKLFDALRASTAQPLDPEREVAEVLQDVTEYFSFTKEEAVHILSELLTANDMTRYGMMNAITHASKSASSYKRATYMEAAGLEYILQEV